MPSGEQVCRIQLEALFDRLRNVEVNDEQIAQFADLIAQQTSQMDQDTFIRHFVAMEFNRFLKYYDGSEDLNVVEKQGDRRGDRGGEGRESRGQRRRGGERTRLKINRGRDDNFTPKSVLNLINDATHDRDIDIHGIEIAPRYSFFDVYKDEAPRIMQAFEQAYRNEDLTIGEARGSRKFDRRGGDDYSHRRDDRPRDGFQRRSERHTRSFRRNK